MTKKPIPSQTDLEPTDSERQKIVDDLVATNAERKARGSPERDLALIVELAFTRYRAQKYQEILGPYLEVCLSEIQKSDGIGPSPADYREAVALAEAQLEAETGIKSPKTTMVSEVANVARHRT